MGVWTYPHPDITPLGHNPPCIVSVCIGIVISRVLILRRWLGSQYLYLRNSCQSELNDGTGKNVTTGEGHSS